MNTYRLLALFVCGTSLTPWTSPAQVFTGSGTGAIPDGGPNGPGDWGLPLAVTFNVSGLSDAVAGMSVSITMRHGLAGDLETLLIPPASSGANPFVIFSRIAEPFGFSGSGTPGHFSADPDGNDPGTYVFSDSASGDLWSAAGFDTSTGTADFGTLANIPPGSYRTSGAGPWDPINNPNAGKLTSFASDSGFIGLSPAQASGTWTLRFRDGFEQDLGVVTAAELSFFTPVPETSLYALELGMGLLALAGYGRYRPTWLER